MKSSRSVRTAALIVVAVAVLGAFAHVAVNTGPFAPVPVTVASVERRDITPGVHGIGTVEARRAWPIGPTGAGRLLRLDVDVGDRVRGGQVIGAMDPVDLQARIAAQQAALRRADAVVRASVAQLEEMRVREAQAEAQARRHDRLLEARFVSADAAEAKARELRAVRAGVDAARANVSAMNQEVHRLSSDLDGLHRQTAQLDLVAPYDGIVTERLIEPGTTVLAGQPVVRMIDSQTLWIDLRVDQSRSAGLREGLSAQIALRSRPNQEIAGRVFRVEPVADPVTEELRAKILFKADAEAPPPLGELAEVTVELTRIEDATSLPNAALHRKGGHIGAWIVDGDRVRFASVRTGASDLEGFVQILEGLSAIDQVVIHSPQALDEHSRIRVVERLPGVPG
ncbi:MAG: efflux RND transporter periplasmic adaptor subunit [Rhodocyclaceae bacterium]|nr:efflux RND transporter periplasmic adaptor subunit [Rhodocyclaceae bacterium]